MFDVFYSDRKPDLFAFEQPAASLEQAAELSRTEFFWYIHGNNDYTDFDFAWQPAPWERDQVHVFASQWQRNGDVYFARKWTAKNREWHFRSEQSVQRLADMSKWTVPELCDAEDFDFSWHPDSTEPNFEYHFGTQWQQAGGPIYKGTEGIKFCQDQKARVLVNETNWTIPTNIDKTKFDFSWHPDPFEPDYEYHFPTQWQSAGGPVYKGTAGIKLCSDQVGVAIKIMSNWKVPDNIDKTKFDFSWHSNPLEPDYEYHFPTQWQQAGGPVYKGTAGVKLCSDQVGVAIKIMSNWKVPDNIDKTKFDFSWHPDPFEPDYEYHFPTQWQPAGGPVYKGTAGIKLNNDQKATALSDKNKWTIPDNIDTSKFDFSWHSNPLEPDYEYHFPTQWQQAGGPVYKGTAGVKLCKDLVSVALSDKTKWLIPKNIKVESFDFSWHPNPLEPYYEYHFGTQWQTAGGPVYKGSAGIKLVNDQKAETIPDITNWVIPENINADSFDFSWHSNPLEQDYEYHFPTQWQPAGGPIYKGTAGVKLSYSQTAEAVIDKTNWVVPDDIDTSDFDFSWHPNPLDPPYSYQFPTQHQKDGGPIYKGTAGLKYCNQQKVRKNSVQIFYMDFLDPGSAERYEELKTLYPDVKRTRYVDNHLTVFKRIVNLATTEFVWITSSICDYAGFDFTWHPEESQREMIHCFYSESQKRGDTFLIHVQSFKNQMYDLELLDWFNVINYVDTFRVPRVEMPVHYYQSDDLVAEIKNYQFTAPYALFTNQPDLYTHWHPCLWTEKDRVVSAFSASKSICAIPRDVKAHLRTQIYDYPHVEDRDVQYFAEEPLDIIYISNGEPDEQFYFDWLVSCVNPSRRYVVKWVRGVNGRTQAYQAAARMSHTPWFFAVFAKLKADKNFDWRWQPDYWQQPKHYIFHARNPVNGLEYGHQAVIAYNKKLVLENNEPGLDFTLTQEHEVIPMLSGEANFNQSEWMTWRTAFREVLKLKQFQDQTPTVENKHRLNTWLTQAQGQFSEYCLQGARDAVDYYAEVNGDYDKLKLSYDWQWLQERFNANSLVQL